MSENIHCRIHPDVVVKSWMCDCFAQAEILSLRDKLSASEAKVKDLELLNHGLEDGSAQWKAKANELGFVAKELQSSVLTLEARELEYRKALDNAYETFWKAIDGLRSLVPNDAKED